MSSYTWDGCFQRQYFFARGLGGKGGGVVRRSAEVVSSRDSNFDSM